LAPRPVTLYVRLPTIGGFLEKAGFSLRRDRMARKVIEQLKDCKTCKRKTLQYKNTKEMSWLMHLFLALITAGLWLIVWFFLLVWHGLTKPIGGKWVCSQCGTEN
jgi:hypothetical protein